MVPVTTLATDLSTIQHRLDNEYSILNEEEVFVWRRTIHGASELFHGGLYLANDPHNVRVQAEVSAWHRLAHNAKPSSNFIEQLSRLGGKNVRV